MDAHIFFVAGLAIGFLAGTLHQLDAAAHNTFHHRRK